jgi:phosphotransferase system HPr (HPr) family protein
MRMLGDANSNSRNPIESTGQVKVRAPYGLSATVARSVVAAARGFRARATLTAFDGHGRGQRADGRNLLELLLLGAVRGEAVTLECVGDDAPAAYQAIAAVLGEGRGIEEMEP